MASETLLSAGIGLIGAVIGATIAGVCSYWAMREQIQDQRRRAEIEAKRYEHHIIREYVLAFSAKIRAICCLFHAIENEETCRDLVRVINIEYINRDRYSIEFGEKTRFLDNETLSSLFKNNVLLDDIHFSIIGVRDSIISNNLDKKDSNDEFNRHRDHIYGSSKLLSNIIYWTEDIANRFGIPDDSYSIPESFKNTVSSYAASYPDSILDRSDGD